MGPLNNIYVYGFQDILIITTAGIYGDLQGLLKNALPKVQYFELPEDTQKKEK